MQKTREVIAYDIAMATELAKREFGDMFSEEVLARFLKSSIHAKIIETVGPRFDDYCVENLKQALALLSEGSSESRKSTRGRPPKN